MGRLKAFVFLCCFITRRQPYRPSARKHRDVDLGEGGASDPSVANPDWCVTK